MAARDNRPAGSAASSLTTFYGGSTLGGVVFQNLHPKCSNPSWAAANFSASAGTLKRMPPLPTAPGNRAMSITWSIFGFANAVRTYLHLSINRSKEFRSSCCGRSFQQRKAECTCLPPERSTLVDKQGQHPAAASNPISNQARPPALLF